MKALKVLFCLMMISLCACSEAVPEVSFLHLPSQPAPPTPQDKSFVDTSTSSGTKTVITNDGYKSQIVIHSGNSLGTVKTSDNYSLEIRSLSL